MADDDDGKERIRRETVWKEQRHAEKNSFRNERRRKGIKKGGWKKRRVEDTRMECGRLHCALASTNENGN